MTGEIYRVIVLIASLYFIGGSLLIVFILLLMVLKLFGKILLLTCHIRCQAEDYIRTSIRFFKGEQIIQCNLLSPRARQKFSVRFLLTKKYSLSSSALSVGTLDKERY